MFWVLYPVLYLDVFGARPKGGNGNVPLLFKVG
jgi:hypothetical protein